MTQRYRFLKLAQAAESTEDESAQRFLAISGLSWSLWCPEPDSNRHGPFRVLGILSLSIFSLTSNHYTPSRNITGFFWPVLCLLRSLRWIVQLQAGHSFSRGRWVSAPDVSRHPSSSPVLKNFSSPQPEAWTTMRTCRWHCGRQTKNISGICDLCWADRENIWKARKAREARADLSESQKAALRKARAARTAKPSVELPVTELWEGCDGYGYLTLNRAF